VSISSIVQYSVYTQSVCQMELVSRASDIIIQPHWSSDRALGMIYSHARTWEISLAAGAKSMGGAGNCKQIARAWESVD